MTETAGGKQGTDGGLIDEPNLSPVKVVDQVQEKTESEAVVTTDTTDARQDWIHAIREAWYGYCRSGLETGRLIVQAELAGNSDPEFRESLPFGAEVYSKLKFIATKKRFTEQNLKYCPPYYSSLYELAMLPRFEFDKAIDAGEIHTSMTRRDAVQLRANSSLPPKTKGRLPKLSAQSQSSTPEDGSPMRKAAEASPVQEIATVFAMRQLEAGEVKAIMTLLNQIERCVSGVRVIRSSVLAARD